jgi:DNA-binding SARP family transcriptional activator
MFGSFRVRCGEREIPRGAWRRSQAKSIFKYLLFHRDIRVSSETLMDIFFTDMDPDRATDALYKAISFLRSVLEPGLPPRKASSYLESDDRSYRMILPSGSSLDIIAFEKAVDRGSIAFKQGDSTLALSSWATALEAYRGDFLQEDPLEEWTALPRERFQASLLQILKEMARLRYARFDYNAARDLLQRILEKDEWDEQSYLLMMKAHLALGQRARAVEVYLKCRDCLKRDLNIEPDGTLTSLYRELFPGSSQRAHET